MSTIGTLTAAVTTSAEHNLEKLNDAHQRLLRMGDFMTCSDPRGHIQQSNRLFDLCIDCGMTLDESDHVAWASTRVAEWLSSSNDEVTA
jgi:hypothetical protein